MQKAIRILLLVVLILYVASPADLCPGPVDDIIAIAAYAYTYGGRDRDED